MSDTDELERHPVHPSYGPCDELGDSHTCSVCVKVIRDLQRAPLRLLDANATLRRQLAEASAMVDEFIAYRDAVAEAGGMSGPLAQETIEVFARRQAGLIDRARDLQQKLAGACRVNDA